MSDLAPDPQALSVDPGRVIAKLTARLAQLETEVAVRDAAIEQLQEQLAQRDSDTAG